MFFRFSNMSPCYQHVYFRYRHNIGITISDHLSCCSSYIVFHRSCTKFNCCKIRRMHYNLGREPMIVLGRQFGDGGGFVWYGCRPPRGPLSRRDGSREKKGAVAMFATRHLRCASKYPVCPSAMGQPLSRAPESHYRATPQA